MRNRALFVTLVGLLAMAGPIQATETCPADVNGDGSVDVGDFFAFVAAFGAGDPAADIDGDGDVDVNDFFSFVIAFDQGCPVTLELAGKPLSQYPFFEFTRAFNAGSTVRIAVDPALHPEFIGVPTDIYVTTARTADQWFADPTLVDVRPGGAQPFTFSGPTIQTNAIVLSESGTLDSDAGIDIGVGYDVVVDVNRNGQLDAGDGIDGLGDEAGFYAVKDLTTLGPLATAPAADYSVSAPGIVSTRRRERVVWPAGVSSMGQLPLIVISHGNGHQYIWYDYLQQHFASHGYIVMSHQNNTGPGIETSAETTWRHTDAFLDELATHIPALVGHVDTSRIVWIGHSRGGEGVVRAYTKVNTGAVTPVHYTADDIVLVSSISPVTFLSAAQTDPADVNYHMLYGSADGDVRGCASSGSRPFRIYSRATGFKQVHYVQGADHNDFNCCGFDDYSGPPGGAIGRTETQQVAKGALLAVVKRYVEGNVPANDYLRRQYEDIRPIGVASDTTVDLQYEESPAAGPIVIDDYQTQPGSGVSSSGGAVSFNVANLFEGRLNDTSGGFTWSTGDPMNGMTYANSAEGHFGVVFDWSTGSPAFYELATVPATRDFTQGKHLSFRACQGTRHPNTIAALGDLTFTVTLRDGSGTTSSINIGAYAGGIEEPFQRTSCGSGPPGWANEFETIRIRVGDFTHNASGIDLGDIEAIRFEFGSAFGSGQGRIGLDDIKITRD